MGIDLSNINISLDAFNAQARGDYNIGQMKLSEDGTSIYRANRHKTLTFLNTSCARGAGGPCGFARRGEIWYTTPHETHQRST